MLLWILIIAGSVILDQATKMIVVNTMEYGQSIVLIKNIFSFQYIHNYGAAWGMFSNHRWVFMLITSLAL
ncbi:MAG: signal peptidase II, partial [Clostridia bacterium]|nr:signal peptidase II [Clostridia bacterium]